jgi:hypothetical protein
MSEQWVVETLTIELDDEVARRAKESALRPQSVKANVEC